MKEETELDVLREIRDLLKAQPIGRPIPAPDVWTINVPKGMTIEKALAECKRLFPVWRWTDENLDEILTSDRTAGESYQISFKANIEADEEYANKSANDLKGFKTITLLERLLLELQYFKETGEHLDIQNWTLCAGSRSPGGFVPRVGWFDDRPYVDWTFVGRRRADLRARVSAI